MSALYVVGSRWHDTVTVRLVGSREEVERYPVAAHEVVLEVHRRAGSRAPVAGDRLSIWRDGSTSYAMAPMLAWDNDA